MALLENRRLIRALPIILVVFVLLLWSNWQIDTSQRKIFPKTQEGILLPKHPKKSFPQMYPNIDANISTPNLGPKNALRKYHKIRGKSSTIFSFSNVSQETQKTLADHTALPIQVEIPKETNNVEASIDEKMIRDCSNFLEKVSRSFINLLSRSSIFNFYFNFQIFMISSWS